MPRRDDVRRVMRQHHMCYARSAMAAYRASADPMYVDMARAHIRTAWAFSRHLWGGPARPLPAKIVPPRRP